MFMTPPKTFPDLYLITKPTERPLIGINNNNNPSSSLGTSAQVDRAIAMGVSTNLKAKVKVVNDIHKVSVKAKASDEVTADTTKIAEVVVRVFKVNDSQVIVAVVAKPPPLNSLLLFLGRRAGVRLVHITFSFPPR
jgi:hypothetical protein